MDTKYQANNKRIAKNTFILYVRMGITMIVQLYTSRVVLQALGVIDYGIYNIVGTVVVMFSFISNPLSTATQRFYNYELGRSDFNKLNKVFNISIYIYAIIAIVMFLLMEPIGCWYIMKQMNIPAERINAAIIAFQFSLFSFLFSLIRTPYQSMIIANERMSFFAYVSIFEVILKLINAFSLSWFGFDRLIMFTLNQCSISIIYFILVLIYSKKEFLATKLRLIWDKQLFRQLFSFTGWSLFGSLASMSADQGVNVIINHFYGVTVNAAVGIASQVSSAVNQFVANFQVAFRPQMVKLYASDEQEALKNLIFSSAKFSYLLLFAIACPIIYNIDLLLKLWLGNVPQYANEFVIFNIVYMLLETISAPLWMTIQATGKIKTYQLIISAVMFLNIVFSVIFLSAGFSPVVVIIIKCILAIVYFVVRILVVRKKIDLSILSFIYKVIIPIVFVTILSSLVYVISFKFVSKSVSMMIVTTFVFYIVYLPSVISFCLSKSEREYLFSVIRNRLFH